MSVVTDTVELLKGTALYFSKSREDVPRNAIKTGLSPCGQVYVGLAIHNDTVTPAKIIPAYNIAYYSFDGKEYNTKDKTYLTVDNGYTYSWVATTAGNIPQTAALVSASYLSEPFYFGRVVMDGEKCVGKVVKSHRVCYVPKSGKEFQYDKYDILCVSKKD